MRTFTPASFFYVEDARVVQNLMASENPERWVQFPSTSLQSILDCSIVDVLLSLSNWNVIES